MITPAITASPSAKLCVWIGDRSIPVRSRKRIAEGQTPGDPMQPRDEVPPGGLSAIHLPFEMADGVNEQQRRLALMEGKEPRRPLGHLAHCEQATATLRR